MLKPDVAVGVHRIEDAYTNWYLIEEDDDVTIVDAGLPTSWRSFGDALGTLGRKPSDVKAVVLTHGHFDHIGFAERARQELGVPVYVHTNDVPLTRHPHQYGHERSRALYLATQRRGLPIAIALTRSRAWWPRAIEDVKRFDSDVVPVPGSPRVVYTPGHTLGHCALSLPDRDVVIAGDALVTLDPYTGRTGPQLVSRAATVDSERAMWSLGPIAETRAKTLLTGHGEPWRDGAESAVDLARAAGVS